VEIGEHDSGGELASLPVEHEVTYFTFTKGKQKDKKRENERERQRGREREREKGSCLVSGPQPLFWPQWEIDMTPSVCQTRLQGTHQTITAACLSLTYNHANKQTQTQMA